MSGVSKRKLLPQAVAMFSEKGARVCQEDTAYANQSRGVFVVADGFGGPHAGFGAAELACESVKHFLEKEAGDLDATLPFVLRSYYTLAGNVLFNALVLANRKLIRENRKKNIHEKGGASVVAGYIHGDELALANAGVCSVALIREGRIKELMVPRSYERFLNPMASSVDPNAPLGRSDHAVPLMALGLSDDLEPEILECRIQKGDWVIFFSDGASPDVFENLAVLNKSGIAPKEGAEEAVNFLSLSKFDDNLSLILAIF